MSIHTILKFPYFFSIGVFLFLAILLTGCGEEEPPKNVGIPPTIAPEYSLPTPAATPTQLPTLTPINDATPTPEIPLKNIVIFDDGFQNGWYMFTEDLYAELTEENVYDGGTSIKIAPRIDASSIYFVSGQKNQAPIRRDDIISVSFYLNGGVAPIKFNDLTIAAQGSNINTFWVEGDRSAITTSDSFFHRTQLAFLGISEIPADTWARVEFLPQEQLFDPNYKNFTGFFLSSYSLLLTPYYIDRIEILVVDE